MNVLHSSMEITDHFYANLNDNEVQRRMDALSKGKQEETEDQKTINLPMEFSAWKQTQLDSS